MSRFSFCRVIAGWLALLALVYLVAGGGEAWVDPGPTTRVSVDSAGGQANLNSFNRSISANGQFVAFKSDATNLAAGDINGKDDVFVHDRQTGATTRVSVDSAGGEGNGFSDQPSISATGRFVAFLSGASNLDRKSTRLNSSHSRASRMPSSA